VPVSASAIARSVTSNAVRIAVGRRWGAWASTFLIMVQRGFPKNPRHWQQPDIDEHAMEPSPQTFEEVGRLCTAWAYLEHVTEQTIWGVLEVDQKVGPVVTYRLDMGGRWSLLTEWAPRKHFPADVKVLSDIAAQVRTVNTDRNIIVHGLIHAEMELPNQEPKPAPYTIVGKAGERLPFKRIPCWTVTRGPEAGKNFPISKEAVERVRLNIQKIGRDVVSFNARFNYTSTVTPMTEVEKDWPKLL
jgi:hypothetical protein